MKYLVILTKSRFVAEQLVKSFVGVSGVKHATCGEATSPYNSNASYGLILPTSYGLIPPEFCDKGYFHCIVTYTESADVEPYRLVIA